METKTNGPLRRLRALRDQGAKLALLPTFLPGGRLRPMPSTAFRGSEQWKCRLSMGLGTVKDPDL